MASVQISIASEGSRWAVKHNGGTLGHAADRVEALRIAEALVRSLHEDGRTARLLEEPRSFDIKADRLSSEPGKEP